MKFSTKSLERGMTFQGKAIAFIDEANITIQAERLGLRIDYKKLLQYLRKNNNLLRAYLYTGVDLESTGLNNFVVMLRRSGYRVVHSRGDERPDGSVKANLDVHLAVDMVSMVEQYDTAILFSGDGDYVPAVEEISRQGVSVDVISMEEHAANNLIDIADRFIDLRELIEENDLIFRSHRGKSKPKLDVDPELERSEKLAVSLVQDILRGIPESAYPLEVKILAKRAHQLDEKGVIDVSSYNGYAAVIKEMRDRRALDIVTLDKVEYVSAVNYGVIRGLLNGE
jgi:uncharacterized LabA/DUF88 family protein